MTKTLSGQPTILIDMDGVIADWMGGVCAEAARIAQTTGYTGELPRPEQFHSFEASECFTDPQQLELLRSAMRSPGLFRGLQPIPGAFEAIRQLQRAGVHVAVCTSPSLENPTCTNDKLAWLAHYGSRSLASQAIITKDKTAARGQLLVDDKPDITGRFRPIWRQVLFTQRYNLASGLPRLNDWSEWELLLDLLALDESNEPVLIR